MNTMMAPGQPSVCFSCGQPIAAPAVSFGTATIRGAAGQFAVREGFEFRVGRDPVQCPIFLSEPRVSAVHATLKFEAGQLMVRDEGSNNGTWVSGARLSPGVWASVAMGQSLRFGPVEFTVQPEV
jgi:pSer/pThr/pTyr-binding forkhead associated (FHA) protein